MFRLSLSGWLAALSCDHHSLRGYMEISSSVEYLSARLYNSSIIAGGSRVLEDCIHTVRINLLDDLSKSSSEIADGFGLPLEDGL